MEQMQERGLKREQVLEIIRTVEPFECVHRMQRQLGYWDRQSRIMAAVANGIVTTVLIGVDGEYVAELKERT